MLEAPAAVRTAARQGPLFIVMNAASGRQDTDSTRATLRRVFDESGREHSMLQVERPGDLAATVRRAVDLACQRGGVVVAVGGDGTMNAAAQALAGRDCAFGAIPQGTFNYFGRTHGISQDAEQAARALLVAQPRAVQAGRVNGVSFLVNASLGLYPQLLQDREAAKTEYGRSRWVAYAAGLASLLKKRHQLRLEIESEDGSTQLVRTPTLFVGNNRLQLDQIGIDAAAHQLSAVLVRPIGGWGLLGLGLRGALGRLGDADNVDSFTFRRLVVTPLGTRRAKLAVDGEVRRMAPPLVFDIAPQPLWLLRTPPA